MSKKATIITIIIFLIIAVVLGYFYFGNKTSTTSSTTSGTAGYQAFNPFGTGTKEAPNPTTETPAVTTTTPTTQVTNTPSLLHKITDFAVAGATYFEYAKPIIAPVTTTITPATQTKTVIKKTTTKKAPTVKVVAPKFEMIPSLRYVEKATGHVYQLSLADMSVGKVSNSTIPQIYEAIFDGTGSTVVYRYLSSDTNIISSYLASFGGASGEFLPSNILDVSLSPDKTKFFYLTQNINGVTGTTRSFNETKSNNVWSSSYTEWLSQWVTPNKIYVTTKASGTVDGNLFSINTTNGIMTKVFGGVPGLTTLANNDGSLVLYNISTDLGPRLKIYNVKNRQVEDLNTFGLPEKCVWSSDGISVYCAIPDSIPGDKTQYPDSWYQGIASFDDWFVKINTSTNTIDTIVNSNDKTPVDGTHLFLGKNEGQLFFINKKDYTLWSLDLI